MWGVMVVNLSMLNEEQCGLSLIAVPAFLLLPPLPVPGLLLGQPPFFTAGPFLFAAGLVTGPALQFALGLLLIKRSVLRLDSAELKAGPFRGELLKYRISSVRGHSRAGWVKALPGIAAW